jgi:calcineurin-like phosphoesterase family protein
MARFITADWHLGDDRMQILQRMDFSSAHEMVEHFIEEHNWVVAEDDEVIVVGDAVALGHPEFLKYVADFNGRKTLIRGNHDRQFTDEELAPYFDTIIPDGDGINLEIEVNGAPQKFWVTHYPTQAREGQFNLVGHIHSAWKVQPNAINVGVDVNHYRPYIVDQDIPFLVNAIQKFYDDDVWAAYHPSQTMHYAPKGRYLDKK